MIQKYKSLVDDLVTFNNEEKRLILRALAMSSEVSHLERLLSLCLDIDMVRGSDAVEVFVCVAHNPNGADLYWKFYQANFVFIHEHFSGGFQSEMLQRALLGYTTLERATEIEEFYSKLNPALIKKDLHLISQAIERIRAQHTMFKAIEKSARL